jgi:hypothetical protein
MCLTFCVPFCDVCYDLCIKTMFGSCYLKLLVGALMSCLCYLCLFAHSGVQHILCCVSVGCLRLVYTMLPIVLVCPSLVFFNVYFL